ncbi:MAG: hypothetical protein NC254_13635 [bacterium]|nr:hypothetical protein [bacterium]
MRKIKKRILGIILGMCVFGGSVGSCYAEQSSLTVDITATRAYGRFEYGEGGHRITVTVSYMEEDSGGHLRSGSVSDNQNGNVTVAVVSKPSPDGYRYYSGYATGYVDGNWTASSGMVYAR